MAGRVEAQHGGCQDRVQRAVMQIELTHRAQRMGERMDGAEPLLKGHGPFERADHHVAAGLDVPPVAHGGFERAEAAGEAIERDRFAGGLKAGAM